MRMNDVSFLMGPEEGSKQAWVEEKEQGLRTAHPDLERVTLFAFETEPGQLEEALLSPSLFASYTLVVLKHYEELRKDSPVNKTIINFINAPDAPASLVVLSSETAYSLPAAITKALPKDRVQTFWELFENKKQDWIRSFFRREGWDISADAIRLILDMVDNNTLEMKQTCSQLLTFFIVSRKADKQIDSEDISSYLTHTKSEDGFSLFAQVARADLRRSLSSLRRILTTDPRAQMSILTILLRQFRMLESFITLRQALGEEEAFKEEISRKLDRLLGDIPVTETETEVKNLAVDASEALRDDRETDTDDLYRDAARLAEKLSGNKSAVAENARDETVDLSRFSGNENKADRIEYKGPSVVSYSLDGRKASRLSIPAYRCMGGGEVTVLITVDPQGNVLNAKIYDDVSSSDPCLREFAVRAARLSRFSALPQNKIRELPRQKGEIVYKFIAQ